MNSIAPRRAPHLGIAALNCGFVCNLVLRVVACQRRYFLVSVVVPYVFLLNYHEIDEDKYGGFSRLAQEGLMPSTGLFQLIWITLYSVHHG